MAKATNSLLQQVIPTQDFDYPEDAKDRRSRKYIPIERPNFSLPLMSTNFRRFNARCALPHNCVLLNR